MHTWILLLRGINVAGKNLLPMKELVRDLDLLGYVDVKTYIQSGNVVLRAGANSSTALEKQIKKQLEARHGFRPEALVLSVDELRSAIRRNPFPAAQESPKTLHVFFLASTPKRPETQALKNAATSTERFELDGRVFYLHAPDGIGRSKLAASAERHLGVAATSRNWRTVTKLADLAEAHEVRASRP